MGVGGTFYFILCTCCVVILTDYSLSEAKGKFIEVLVFRNCKVVHDYVFISICVVISYHKLSDFKQCKFIGSQLGQSEVQMDLAGLCFWSLTRLKSNVY